MSALDPQSRRQIEEALGRPLIEEELVPVGGLGDLTAAEREVARLLADRQSALCCEYLQSLASASAGATLRFIEALRSPRVHPVPAVDITLGELHEVLTTNDESALPAVGVAITVLRAALASGDDESTTLASKR